MGVGDLNNDNIKDIAVGVPGDSPNGVSGAGSTYIAGPAATPPMITAIAGSFDTSSTYQGKQWIRLDGNQTNGSAAPALR